LEPYNGIAAMLFKEHDWMLNLISFEDTDSLSEIKACGESVRLHGACDRKAVSVKQEENIKC